MVKRRKTMGRPLVGDGHPFHLNIRLDQRSKEALEYLCDKRGLRRATSKSDVIRSLILAKAQRIEAAKKRREKKE